MKVAGQKSTFTFFSAQMLNSFLIIRPILTFFTPQSSSLPPAILYQKDEWALSGNLQSKKRKVHPKTCHEDPDE